MTVKDMSAPEKMDQFAMELAEFMFHMTTEYKGYEKEVAKLLARQLGAYVSIVSKNPAAALNAVAEVVRNHDYVGTRADHFGYTLGADATKKPKVITRSPNIVNIGEFKGKRDDAG